MQNCAFWGVCVSSQILGFGRLVHVSGFLGLTFRVLCFVLRFPVFRFGF